VKNIEDTNLLVNQVGAYGLNLGRVDFYFDEQNNKTASGTTILV
jgi:5'-nucleotidase